MQSVTESNNLPAASQLPPTTGDVAAANAAAESFRRLLMGNAKGNMNLNAVKARGEDLRKSLDQIVTALQFNAHNIKWNDILNRFAVLNVQYHNLAEQLRPLLKHYVVFPKSVNQQNATILPIMLASKALPEMEAEEAELLAGHHAAMGSMRVEEQYEALGAETDNLNRVIDQLTAGGAGGAMGVLHPQHPLQLGLGKTLRASAATSGSTLKRAGSGARGGSQAKRRKLEAADALMAALTSGDGLRL
ncbi:hypothetical protein WJX72_000336 [[Myrmecia] bisecta]|uniref:Mediator of RNA polymerase II transcription subunit 8 n=1 Tax=[Myrmecia] bisecta TaxID=41462 RepID=A0AAW1P7D7_9CHLO